MQKTSFTDIVLPPNVKVNVINSRRNVIVFIESEASFLNDIDWRIETLMTIYHPFKTEYVQLSERNIIKLYFYQSLWTSLSLMRFYEGEYLGSNLLDYFETENSAFGIPFIETDDKDRLEMTTRDTEIPLIAGMFAVAIAGSLFAIALSS
jgi:hypothetical protein